MNKKEMNMRAAEACGLSVEVARTGGYYVVVHRTNERPEGYVKGAHHISMSGALSELPNFVGDLNACADMERAIYDQPNHQRVIDYESHLCGNVPYPIRATAEQRVEAFLYAVGRS